MQKNFVTGQENLTNGRVEKQRSAFSGDGKVIKHNAEAKGKQQGMGWLVTLWAGGRVNCRETVSWAGEEGRAKLACHLDTDVCEQPFGCETIELYCFSDRSFSKEQCLAVRRQCPVVIHRVDDMCQGEVSSSCFTPHCDWVNTHRRGN